MPSLVGSEMCIRDRPSFVLCWHKCSTLGKDARVRATRRKQQRNHCRTMRHRHSSGHELCCTCPQLAQLAPCKLIRGVIRGRTTTRNPPAHIPTAIISTLAHRHSIVRSWFICILVTFLLLYTCVVVEGRKAVINAPAFVTGRLPARFPIIVYPSLVLQHCISVKEGRMPRGAVKVLRQM